ncbi:MAG: hypothetical protein L6Q35_05400 [Phycisphaerales bacterium]|nr:hypothetical protein [Phycisphaerales bacterium]
MQFNDRGIMIAVILIVLVGGGIFTLWWWRLADKWAHAEQRRFRKAGLRPGDEPKRVVLKGFENRGPADKEPGRQP